MRKTNKFMKTSLIMLCCIMLSGSYLNLNAQEYKIITIVESIVPGGMGRSRIIEHQENQNVDDLTTDRSDGTTSYQSEIKRNNIKIDKFSETKLLNFYSGVGINFRNIASNDAVISDKISSMCAEGWKLQFVTSGVESVGSDTDNYGIFITRLFFTR